MAWASSHLRMRPAPSAAQHSRRDTPAGSCPAPGSRYRPGPAGSCPRCCLHPCCQTNSPRSDRAALAAAMRKKSQWSVRDILLSARDTFSDARSVCCISTINALQDVPRIILKGMESAKQIVRPLIVGQRTGFELFNSTVTI